ncbi:NAD(P)/FAD-dependent oxidoreductase [Tomitella gaofuii]|uniref:NAD(P)/FAD-dependent oxidoreductase n=1 Tax=Tomitella gaofuii TaxID=2760083 RepID=UPI0015FE71E4|nr:FAD-dependent oxidoreductase [Tomitella gaofuii]
MTVRNGEMRSVAVVGAGMVGLSTAWHLQERGIEVTVFDENGPAAGSSWGNAGWITPALSTPLPEPAVLAYGLRQLLRPSSPVYVPPSAALDPGLVGFLARFARNSTPRRWRRAMESLVRINRHALEAFDKMVRDDEAMAGCLHEADPFIVGYTDPSQTQSMVDEARQITDAGQPVQVDELPIDEARRRAPMLSPAVRATLLLQGQRYLHPPKFVAALADAVTARGGAVRGGVRIDAVRDRGRRSAVVGEAVDGAGAGGAGVAAGDAVDFEADAVVLADGADLNAMAGRFGVRAQVRAGRGYSFSVPVDRTPPGPLYFPVSRVACTPLGDRLRVAGMMEFRHHDAPMDPRRIAAVVDSVRPLLTGVDLDDRRDEWVGSRPCTADGLPLIGATGSQRVFVAGGHGMWGMTLGPATGMLLAEAIDTGRIPEDIAAFDPLR